MWWVYQGETLNAMGARGITLAAYTCAQVIHAAALFEFKNHLEELVRAGRDLCMAVVGCGRRKCSPRICGAPVVHPDAAAPCRPKRDLGGASATPGDDPARLTKSVAEVRCPYMLVR